MYFPVSAWFSAFVLTVAIEAPLVWLFLRRQEPDLLRLGLLIVFANLVTHPAVWFIWTQLFLVGWHGCPDHATAPKANTDWWRAKLAANRARDEDTETRLSGAGWLVLVV